MLPRRLDGQFVEPYGRRGGFRMVGRRDHARAELRLCLDTSGSCGNDGSLTLGATVRSQECHDSAEHECSKAERAPPIERASPLIGLVATALDLRSQIIQSTAIANHERGFAAGFTRSARRFAARSVMVGDDHAARLFGHVGPRPRRVHDGLLRDDRVVAELLQLVQPFGLLAGDGPRGRSRARHRPGYSENPKPAPDTRTRPARPRSENSEEAPGRAHSVAKRRTFPYSRGPPPESCAANWALVLPCNACGRRDFDPGRG